MLRSFDCSVYSGEITPEIARLALADGFVHFVEAFDTTPLSYGQHDALLGAGFSSWDCYRFLYFNREPEAQIDNCVQAIYARPDPLPGLFCVDVEDDPPANDPRSWIRRAMDRVESYDIRPAGTKVRPCLYTGRWWWQKYLAGWTEPADRGWPLWDAWWGHPDPDDFVSYGGWTRCEGRQYQGNLNLAYLPNVDGDVFRERAPAPPRPAPDVRPVIAAIQNAAGWNAEALRLLGS